MALNQKYHLGIVSPAKDEEDNVEALVETVAAQKVIPDVWVLVNDGSVDKTVELFEKSLLKHKSFQENCEVHVVNYQDKEKGYALGQKYSRVVRFGLDRLLELDHRYDFVGVLDCDIQLPKNYYQEVIKRLVQNSTLGIVSAGSQIEFENGKSMVSTVNKSHAPGGFRVWRKECLDDTEYVPSISQDSVSEARAIMMGWKVRSFREIEITMRKRGAKHGFDYYGRSAYIRHVSEFYVWMGIIRLVLQGRLNDGKAYKKGFYDAKRRKDDRITDSLAIKYFKNRLFYRLIGR